MSEVVNAMVDGLVSYLKETAPIPGSLTERVGALCNAVLPSFPQNKALRYPTISVHAASNVPRHHAPVQLREITAPEPGKAEGKFLWAVGTVTASFQLDIFAKTQKERARVLEALRRDMRPGLSDGLTSSLTLTLPDYFDETASYRIAGGGDFNDSAYLAQREEWRSLVTVEADAREVIAASVVELRTLIMRFSIPIAVPGFPEPQEDQTIFGGT